MTDFIPSHKHRIYVEFQGDGGIDKTPLTCGYIYLGGSPIRLYHMHIPRDYAQELIEVMQSQLDNPDRNVRLTFEMIGAKEVNEEGDKANVR